MCILAKAAAVGARHHVRALPKAMGQSQFSLVLYRWQRPRSIIERMFNVGAGDAVKTYYLRAVLRQWKETETVQTGSDAENQTLRVPLSISEEVYLRDKLALGVLAHFNIPHDGAVAPAHFAGLPSLFTGELRGWDEKDYFVRPLNQQELQAYDAAQPAKDDYDTRCNVAIPHAYLASFGAPEAQVFETLPFGVYASLSVPVGSSQIQVLFDDTEVDVAQQRKLLPSRLFSERPGDEEGAPASALGLVLSRVSLLVDGVKVSVFVPLCQLE